MKKAFKRFSLLVLVFSMLFSLCSCFNLEALRERHAIMQDTDTVILSGKTYKRLPECDNFSPPDQEYTSLYITNPDVPLLLASSESNPAYSNKSGEIITVQPYGYSDHIYYETVNYLDALADSKGSLLFCREDVYDEMLGRINDKDKDYFYCARFYTDDCTMYYYLSEEQADAIKNSLAVSSNQLSDTTYNPFAAPNSTSAPSVYIERRSADGYFTDPEYFDYSLIYQTDNGDYLFYFAGSSKFKVWKISKEYNTLFDDMYEEIEKLQK